MYKKKSNANEARLEKNLEDKVVKQNIGSKTNLLNTNRKTNHASSGSPKIHVANLYQMEWKTHASVAPTTKQTFTDRKTPPSNKNETRGVKIMEKQRPSSKTKNTKPTIKSYFGDDVELQKLK